MTTRAGWVGILTGLVLTILFYLLFMIQSDAFLQGWQTGSIAIAIASMLTMSGGFLAGRQSGSVHPGRCSTLGALTGGLSGVIVFCLWGAAMAGLTGSLPSVSRMTAETIGQQVQAETIAAIIRQTLGMFLILFLSGIGLGAIGGRLACPHQQNRADVFDKAAPQMALNVSITAVPASLVAAALSIAIFSHLADSVGEQMGKTIYDRAIMDMPLTVSLLLVLISHFALMSVIPHEAQQAEHLCGMDEVKMAAYVGIGAAPALILLLFLIHVSLFSNPLVLLALTVSIGMSLKSLHALLKLVLPRRASFPSRQEGWQKTEAILFGTIANSHGPRLAALCTGCGLVMVLPLYVCVLSVLINLSSVAAISTEGIWRLFLIQALVSSGTVTASIVLLTTIYLFYLNLGRWFSKWNSGRSN